MNDGRKALMVNRYETITDQQLREASARQGLRVCPKVGVAEVLNIQNSGITSEEYTYALKANFDFVVATDNDVAYPLFAVEFDEPHHRTDPKTIRRDRMKNALCERFRLPLLRIDEGWLRPIRQWTVLTWIIEVQGLYDAWRQEQEEGRIPWEEDFYWPLIFDVDGQGRLVDRPYDLALEAIRALHEACARGVTTTPVEQQISREDEHGYMVCYGVLPLAAGGYIIEQGRCWSFHFRPVTPATWPRTLPRLPWRKLFADTRAGGTFRTARSSWRRCARERRAGVLKVPSSASERSTRPLEGPSPESDGESDDDHSGHILWVNLRMGVLG